MNGLFGNAGPLDQLADLHDYLGWDGETRNRNMPVKN
jgi:hypothetical protein